MTESELKESMLNFIDMNEDDGLWALIDGDDNINKDMVTEDNMVDIINEHYTIDHLSGWIEDIICEKGDSEDWMYEEGREGRELINKAKQFV